MDANYIYEIFETTRKHNLPDLYVGLAMLQKDKPVPDELIDPKDKTDRPLREFIGRHYTRLAEAYKTKDCAIFAAAVAECEEEDRQKESAQSDQVKDI